ncbi:MAG: DUF1127 domain-containing protein [Proteobacteria bacterium]|nr:DUF1127 domain-containing protein [Pseudomonadota bacterium]
MMTYYMTETTAGTAIATEQRYGSAKVVKSAKSEPKTSFLRTFRANLSSKFADYKKRQQAKRELYGMSGRELSELGVSRMEIDTIVDGPAKPSLIKISYNACKDYISQRLRERAGYVHLMQMDDRQLKDLGLTRNLVERAANDQMPSAHNDNNPASIVKNDRRKAV